MHAWSVAEIRELVRAIREVGGDSFYTRRVLQRLDREEITIREAIERLKAARELTQGAC